MERKLRVRETKDVKLVAIGNSKGVRLPRGTLMKYGFVDSLVLEETDQGIFLRRKEKEKLSWKETAQEMAREVEDWSDLDVTVADGLEHEP
jgi:antitoxin MazE